MEVCTKLHQNGGRWLKCAAALVQLTEVEVVVVCTKVLGVVQLLPVVEMVMVCTKVVGVGAVVVQATLV